MRPRGVMLCGVLLSAGLAAGCAGLPRHSAAPDDPLLVSKKPLRGKAEFTPRWCWREPMRSRARAGASAARLVPGSRQEMGLGPSTLHRPGEQAESAEARGSRTSPGPARIPSEPSPSFSKRPPAPRNPYTVPEPVRPSRHAPTIPDRTERRRQPNSERERSPPGWITPSRRLGTTSSCSAVALRAWSRRGLPDLGEVALIERDWMGGDCLVTGASPPRRSLRAARACAEVRERGHSTSR